jgi:signal transduction histidine kinase
MRTLSETAAVGWPLAATLAVALFGQIRGARKRSALKEALHELRRPLQALLLSSPVRAGSSAALALAALTRLERVIDGGGAPPLVQTLVAPRSLLEQAAERWSEPAARLGGTVRLRWSAGAAKVLAEPAQLEAAVDNLIANALEHGAPPVRIEASSRAGRIRIAVIDAGPAGPGVGGRRSGRGHGLKIVRRFAARHGGRFFLEHRAAGTVAVLELPIVTGAAGRSAA